jgi:2-octaprenyl-3-methyl-6-methoxy-1,4-benzoquinol hydroxylase
LSPINTVDADILIIGAGIAGPALAVALRDAGRKILLIEKSDQPADTARGDHLQPFTQDIFERWQVLDAIRDAGAEKRRGSIWYAPDGKEIFFSDLSQLDIDNPHFLFLNHEKIATTLLDIALQSPDVDIVRPLRNWWLEESPEDVTRIRVGLAGGDDLAINAKLIVGADGRASRVRKLFHFTPESHHYEQSIGVLFADRDTPLPDNNLQVFLRHSKIISVIPRTGGHCKIGIPMSPTDAREWRKADADELAQRVKSILPELRVSNVQFGDVYPPVRVSTDRWCKGNVVLIGDSCHAMHPARSQGMNIAIRCIDQLAEQLRTVRCFDNIAQSLDNYERLARPPVDEMLTENHKQGLQMDTAVSDGYQALQDRFKNLRRDRNALQNYSMYAAGYRDAKFA